MERLEDGDALEAQVGELGRLLWGVGDEQVGVAEHRSRQRSRAGERLVRNDVVADDDPAHARRRMAQEPAVGRAHHRVNPGQHERRRPKGVHTIDCGSPREWVDPVEHGLCLDGARRTGTIVAVGAAVQEGRIQAPPADGLDRAALLERSHHGRVERRSTHRQRMHRGDHRDAGSHHRTLWWCIAHGSLSSVPRSASSRLRR